MDTPKIQIVITADKKLADKLTDTIGEGKSYKYLHTKLLLSRLRMVKKETEDLPEEDQIKIMRNVIIAERNIAALAATQYAELNRVDVFDELYEVVQELDELLKSED